jgi:tRNA1Val (adenine37-N6)-methyltransferase
VQSGKVSRGDERALGRHEVLCGLGDVVSAAARLLEPRGRFCIVYPVGRLPELLRVSEDNKLRPARLRLVYGRVDLAPKNCLLEAVRGGRMSLKVERPLIMYDSSGEYTEEVKVMLYPAG